MTMVKPAALTHILSEANTSGVLGALLLKMDGTLLAFSGPADRDARVTSAISSNIWAAYSKLGVPNARQQLLQQTVGSNYPQEPEDKLNAILMDCEEGRVCALQVAGLLLCVYSTDEVGFGMLKLKTEALANYLEQPLIKVSKG